MFKMFASIHESPSEIRKNSLREAALNIRGSTRITEINTDDPEEAVRLFHKTEEYDSFCKEREYCRRSTVYSYLIFDNGTIVRTDIAKGNLLCLPGY